MIGKTDKKIDEIESLFIANCDVGRIHITDQNKLKGLSPKEQQQKFVNHTEMKQIEQTNVKNGTDTRASSANSSFELKESNPELESETLYGDSK